MRKRNRRCVDCNLRLATDAGTFSFVYQDMRFTIYKETSVSCEECEKTGFAKLFDKYSHCFNYNDTRISGIDWRLFCREQKENDGEINKLFIQLGVFASNRAGNWQIVSNKDSSNMNPKYNLCTVYFRNFTDAVSYSQCMYSNLFDWQIQHIAEIYLRDAVMKMNQLDRNDINFTFANNKT